MKILIEGTILADGVHNPSVTKDNDVMIIIVNCIEQWFLVVKEFHACKIILKVTMDGFFQENDSKRKNDD